MGKASRLTPTRTSPIKQLPAWRRPVRLAMITRTVKNGGIDATMETGEEDDVVPAELSATEMRANLVRLAFGGDEWKLQEFCTQLARSLPPDTAGVMRGSSVTGIRWEDGTPFDALGAGTSDLDLTLVG